MCDCFNRIDYHRIIYLLVLFPFCSHSHHLLGAYMVPLGWLQCSSGVRSTDNRDSVMHVWAEGLDSVADAEVVMVSCCYLILFLCFSMRLFSKSRILFLLFNFLLYSSSLLFASFISALCSSISFSRDSNSHTMSIISASTKSIKNNVSGSPHFTFHSSPVRRDNLFTAFFISSLSMMFHRSSLFHPFFEMQKYKIGAPHHDAPLSLFGNPVAAEGFSFALGTSMALPDAVEVVGGGIYQLRFVGEDAGLEIAVVVAFHTYAGAREVGGADIGGGAVENHYLEMHPWTEPPLQAAPQSRILVEILAEVLARLLGVQQTHVDTTSQQLVEHRQKRHHISTSLHI